MPLQGSETLATKQRKAVSTSIAQKQRQTRPKLLPSETTRCKNKQSPIKVQRFIDKSEDKMSKNITKLPKSFPKQQYLKSKADRNAPSSLF